MESVEKERIWLPALVFFIEERTKLVLLIIITISLLSTLTSLFFTIPYLMIFGPSEEVNLVKESEYGSTAALVNTLIFLTIAVLATMIMLFLIRRKMINILTYIMILLMSYLASVLSMMFIPLTIAIAFLTFFPKSFITIVLLENYEIIFFATGTIFFTLTMISMLSSKMLNLRNSILFLTAVFIGILLGTSSGFYTPIILLTIFAMYDIFTVYKGPLGKLMDEIVEESPISYAAKKPLIIGLGDIAFFSIPIAYSLAYFDLLWTVIVIISIFIGFFITGIIFIILAKKKKKAVMPGLPIPIAFALITILVRLFL